MEINKQDIEKEREIIKDLQQQLAEMTEKYNACQEARKLESEFNSQDKKELKQQLAEKDGEIATLYKTIRRISNEKANIINREQIDYLSFATQLRHEICEKIRDKVQEEYHKEPLICSNDGDIVFACVYLNTINQLLDKIEKGE